VVSSARRPDRFAGHHSGLNYLCALLKSAKSDIANEGYISERIRQKIVSAFYFWDCIFALTCGYAGPQKQKRNLTQLQTLEPKMPIDVLPSWRLSTADERISQFEGLATEREDLAVDAEARRFSLPPMNTTDKLRRYVAPWIDNSIRHGSAGASATTAPGRNSAASTAH